MVMGKYRMYISGKISGLPYEEAFERFQTAESFLQKINIEPVNPMKNGLPVDAEYQVQIGRDIELVLSSDGIYMLNGWQESKGALLEYYAAKMYGKDLWFEETETTVNRIARAIYQVTGLSLSGFTSPQRTDLAHYCRLCFVHHCKKAELPIAAIVRATKRNKFSVFRNLRKYESEYKYNPVFRNIADKVNEALKAQEQ